MKNFKILPLALLIISVVTQCSTEEASELKPPITVVMKFEVDGSLENFSVKFVYDKFEKRYVPDSELVGEVYATNSETQENVFGYYLKAQSGTRLMYEIRQGYVGYSASAGCWFYGTLVIGDDGTSVFIPGELINQLLNPPLCGYYYV